MQLLQISGINARDADKILHHAMVCWRLPWRRESDIFSTQLLWEARMLLSPGHVPLPPAILNAQLADEAGCRRDLLPRMFSALEGMKRCYAFVHGLPNMELLFTPAALQKIQSFNSFNIGSWPACFKNYADDQLAALRQVQRHRAIRDAASLGLLVMFDVLRKEAPSRIASVQRRLWTKQL